MPCGKLAGSRVMDQRDLAHGQIPCKNRTPIQNVPGMVAPIFASGRRLKPSQIVIPRDSPSLRSAGFRFGKGRKRRSGSATLEQVDQEGNSESAPSVALRWPADSANPAAPAYNSTPHRCTSRPISWNTVSYTHLDVYKRQGKQHERDCRAYCAGRILMVRSQVSTACGQVVTGSAVRRNP